jgi:hypothetical protein
MVFPVRPAPLACVVFCAALSSGSSCPGLQDCDSDDDCGLDRVCVAGSCVGCRDTDDCDGGAFCCQGQCLPESELSTHCGCGPALSASAGQDCNRVEPSGVCLVDDATATVDSVARGSCGCGCTPAEGGPLCLEPDAPGDQARCSCRDNGDCRLPSVDAEGRPHQSTDTCTPDDACVCFSLGTATACDPNGAAPDCTGDGGCRDLLGDATNCGVAGHSCLTAATGLATEGACVQGGCVCDDLTDCQGDGLNVNTCAYVAPGAPSQCVCSGYTRGGVQAPCPMELACGIGGCVLDGQPVATEEALRASFGLP